MAYLRAIIMGIVFFAIITGGYFLLFPPAITPTYSGPIETASWEQLIRPGAYDIFDNYEALDAMTDDEINDVWLTAESATNALMDGKRVQIPGFMVSLDLETDRRVDSFIFVPYQGACIHTPPPPPNQTIFVKAPDGTKVWDNWEPVEITGVLKIEQSEHDIASAGFTLEMESIKAFEYNRTDPDYAVANGAHSSN